MADITEERLREIATSDPLALAICAQMGEPSWADVRAIAAELLAARARIAKLEQEPPMALVDFGVGFNWKGLHEDMQRLRAERDAALKRMVELDEVRAAQGELLAQLPPSADQLVMAEMDAAVARTERDAARAEVAAVEAAISDRGVAERDCRLPVAERIDNILVELKECSLQFGTAAMENERLCAEVERLRADLREAMELLAQVDDGQVPHDAWLNARDALLEKHKETP